MSKTLADILRVIRAQMRSEERKPFFRKSEFWNTGSTVIVACFTVGLVVVGCLQTRILDRTDETQRTIQRAFILPRSIQITGLQKRDPKDIMLWEMDVNWENTGSTATRKLSILTAWRILNGTDEKPALTPFKPPTPETEASGALTMSKWQFAPFAMEGTVWPTTPHITVLGPHQIRVGDSTIYSAGSMQRFQKGIASVAIIGIASYLDVFGKKRITMFCQQLIVPDIDYQNGEPDKPHAVGGPDCQDYNCIDDDCQKYKDATWLPPDVLPIEEKGQVH